ncbi:MAG: N-formylglutamate amidohydrolase [Alphaproteobacteria bacterium]|nr:N-formylglutamate amidohydrolase [Alphaproteobacteria bacterium]
MVCDHASNFLPAPMNRLGIAPHQMNEHIAWDIGAAEVACRLATRIKASAVLSSYSRLLIDCNRDPGDPAAIPPITGGVTIPGNHALPATEVKRRQEAFFWPYHGAVAKQIARVSQRGTPPAVVAIHSFTPNLCGDRRPWHVGVLWNRDPRIAAPALEHLRTDRSLCVGDNQPYSAREIGYTVDRHAARAGLPHITFEIRQDQLADVSGCSLWAARLGNILTKILSNRSVFRAAIY